MDRLRIKGIARIGGLSVVIQALSGSVDSEQERGYRRPGRTVRCRGAW